MATSAFGLGREDAAVLNSVACTLNNLSTRAAKTGTEH